MLFSSMDTKKNTDVSILVYKFRPERTGFNEYAEYKQLQLTFLHNLTANLRIYCKKNEKISE